MERIPRVKKSTISDYKHKWFPNLQPFPSGRHSVLNDTSRSAIRKKVVLGELKIGKEVKKYLNDLGYKIGYSACLKLLHSLGFQAAKNKKKPLLKANHRKQRLEWAKARRSWTKDDWRRMVFSGETKINIWGSDGIKYCWKRPDDKLQFHHLDLTVKHGDGSLIMCDCITYDGPGYACQIFDETIKKEDYIQ